MNILILGSGGREHALAWAVMQNPKCDRLIVAPGNAGMAQIAECAKLDIEDGGAVATFVQENTIDFVIVGPEAPLAKGVADRLREAGIKVFGPSARQRSWKPRKASPKRFATQRMRRRQPTGTSPMPRLPRLTSANRRADRCEGRRSGRR